MSTGNPIPWQAVYMDVFGQECLSADYGDKAVAIAMNYDIAKENRRSEKRREVVSGITGAAAAVGGKAKEAARTTPVTVKKVRPAAKPVSQKPKAVAAEQKQTPAKKSYDWDYDDNDNWDWDV